MAHEAQIKFCKEVKEKFPHMFKDVNVVDFGSLDLNGNNKYLFEKSLYLGIDIAPGKNVDHVSLAHEYRPLGRDCFDVVISTEMLEHDPYWEKSLRNMVNVLRPGGLLLITCATTGRPEHGTVNANPNDSPLTVNRHDSWSTYYRNKTREDVRSVIDFETEFTEYQIIVFGTDLQIWGIKR